MKLEEKKERSDLKHEIDLMKDQAGELDFEDFQFEFDGTMDDDFDDLSSQLEFTSIEMPELKQQEK